MYNTQYVEIILKIPIVFSVEIESKYFPVQKHSKISITDF